MDRMQKQSILIMLNSIEQQLAAIRGLLALGPSEESAPHLATEPRRAMGMTTKEEDEQIEQALAIEDQKQDVLAELFKRAQENQHDVIGQ